MAILLPFPGQGRSLHLPSQSEPDECFTSLGSSGQSALLMSPEEEVLLSENDSHPETLLWKFLTKRKAKNKKLIAALLAFPFPFGIVGLHRIYLGTAPHVPIVYIATVGGGFGILPLIDFFIILSSPDIESYFNNQQVFMWKR